MLATNAERLVGGLYDGKEKMSTKRDDGLKTYEWGDPAVPCDSRNVAAMLSSPLSTLDEFVESLNHRWCTRYSTHLSGTVSCHAVNSGRLTSYNNHGIRRLQYNVKHRVMTQTLEMTHFRKIPRQDK